MKIHDVIAAYLPLTNRLLAASSGVTYRALFLEPNLQAIRSNASFDLMYEMRSMYLLGILERSHLSCVTYLARTSGWLTATLNAMQVNSLLGFAGGLRGHLESAADAFDFLQHLPNSLSKSMKYAYLTFSHPADLGATWVGFGPLENALIHYVYARRNPGPSDPPEHNKKSSWTYNEQLENFGVPRMHELYGVLCELVHPAAPSVLCFLTEDGKSLTFNPNRDAEIIEEMTSQYEDTILKMTQITLNSALMSLSLLHRLNPAWIALSDGEMKDVGNISLKLEQFDQFVATYSPGQADRMDIVREVSG